MKIICKHCKSLFEPRPNIRNQRYCSMPSCQKARQLAWRPKISERSQKDLEDKKAAQARWRAKNPDYWKKYRRERASAGKQSNQKSLKSGALSALMQLQSGFFELKVIRQNRSVKTVVYLVELTLLKDLNGIL